jgi:hypothetical protein
VFFGFSLVINVHSDSGKQYYILLPGKERINDRKMEGLYILRHVYYSSPFVFGDSSVFTRKNLLDSEIFL